MLTLIKVTGFRYTPSGSRRKIGLFKCSCGKIKEISVYNVESGRTISCGCQSIKQITKLGLLRGNNRGSYKHGMFGTRFYNIFYGIKSRCENKNSGKSYEWYGGKGIKNKWKKFGEFKKDMYESYLNHCEEHGERQTTIDRIDSSKDYYKENCKWATYKEQAKEKRTGFIPQN